MHPAIEHITVEGILHALSDPVRVAIYAELAGSDCATICSNFLQVSDRSVPKSTLSQHFRALREAGLVRSERHGGRVCKEIEQRFPGLIPAILNAHRVQAAGRTRATKRKRTVRKTN